MPEISHSPLVAGVELGGTKCVCILASGPADVREEVRIATTDPVTTLAGIEAVLDRWPGIAALGIASFGPIELNRAAPDWGHITRTTKPGWSGANIAARLRDRLQVPVAFETDVVGAAIGEARWGAAQGLDGSAYVTVGTGVGVGILSRGVPLVGFMHGELGHLRLARAPGDDWPGECPFHGDCVEGLVSGPAIAARTGRRAETLAASDPAWDAIVHTLGLLIHTLVVTAAPRRIVMGGGVMQQVHLFPRLRAALAASLGGYVVNAVLDDLDTYIVPPALGARSGSLGAVALAQAALHRRD